MPSPPQKKPMTPSERAAASAAKVKELQAKRQSEASPGPGAYEPKKMVAATSHSGAAFKSATDRSKLAASTAVPNTVGDPGAYEVRSHRSIATQASSSIQTSSKKGVGGFGGTSKRGFKLENVHPTTPGADSDATPAPSAYTPLQTETGREHDMHVMNGAETMKSAVFASGSRRPGLAIPSADAPGPGKYDPNLQTVGPRVTHAPSVIGRDTRYTADHIDGTGDDCTTGAHVGPGSYEPRRTNGGDCGSLAGKAEAGLPSAGGSSAALMSASMQSETQRPATADLW